MFFPIKRIRKGSPDPKKSIRLNRAEFGHSFKDKKAKYDMRYYIKDVKGDWDLEDANKLRKSNPDEYIRKSLLVIFFF